MINITLYAMRLKQKNNNKNKSFIYFQNIKKGISRLSLYTICIRHNLKALNYKLESNIIFGILVRSRIC